MTSTKRTIHGSRFSGLLVGCSGENYKKARARKRKKGGRKKEKGKRKEERKRRERERERETKPNEMYHRTLPFRFCLRASNKQVKHIIGSGVFILLESSKETTEDATRCVHL